MFNQAVSRGICSRTQALTHNGGEQGREVALSYFLAGITAYGLFQEHTR
jgi:hypothetical protein